MEASSSQIGTVFLVGAGPGDPGLVTLRAASLLRRADAVVFDYLVDDAVLELANPAAHMVDVGKRPGRPVGQASINATLIELAHRFQRVVRLKGGDPFVFGRGAEEALALMEVGIPFEVVPGVSSAIAVPAYGGVTLTHRGLSTGFTVITGRTGDDVVREQDWKALVDGGTTLVLMMGVGTRAEVATSLMRAGMPRETSVVIVTSGTRPDQEVRRCVLGELGAMEIRSPSVITIGGSSSIDVPWFDRRPLFGLEVVVTRAAGSAEDLVTSLQDRGATVVQVPTIAIAPPSDGGDGLERARRGLSDFDWIVFTSAKGVVALLDGVPDVRVLAGVGIAAIGTATADALRGYGISPDLIPPEFLSESLLEVFPKGPGSVLLPVARRTREVLPTALEERGWQVDVVEAYETVAAEPNVDALASPRRHRVRTILFTSSSTIERFVEAFGIAAVPAFVGVIGPATQATAESKGIDVAFTASEHSAAGLVDALVHWWSAYRATLPAGRS